MRTFPDVRMRKLHALAAQGNDAAQAQDYPSAREHFGELLRQLDGLGLESAWVHWALAVAHDNLGDLDMALNEIRSSLEMDPLSPMAQRSFDIIVRRIRDHLASLDVGDSSIPRLYGLLQQSGDVDVPTHLIMARHFAATARVERAQQLLAALSLTAPASREVWGERARLARLEGDLTAAAGFEVEMESHSLHDVPFAIPTRNEG